MGRIHSPCTKDCTRRSIDPNCHNSEYCEAWGKYVTEKEIENRKVFEGRQKYAAESRQVLESCLRNKYYQTRKKR